MDRRDQKELELMCYGIGVGVALAETQNPYKIGQRTEAIRLTQLAIIRNKPKAFQRKLKRMLKAQGIELNLERPTNEGTGKP